MLILTNVVESIESMGEESREYVNGVMPFILDYINQITEIESAYKKLYKFLNKNSDNYIF
jgi:hypothetical protein